jgi:hypothetical protein
MTEKAVIAKLAVTLRPFTVPNFVGVVLPGADENTSLPLSALDEDALEDMCLSWVRAVYEKAGRKHAPFYKPEKAEPRGDQ